MQSSCLTQRMGIYTMMLFLFFEILSFTFEYANFYAFPGKRNRHKAFALYFQTGKNICQDD